MEEKKNDRIRIKNITDEMKSAYLDYAMSVITSRALPDVRDGLKPVQRRILFAMLGIGLRPSAKTRKSAAVVGETVAKYHPHGTSAVYEAMVKMAQDFLTRYPLVIGQGNFGSIDGDPPAAERYTEAKMSSYSEMLLEWIEKDTVNFIPNYENTFDEPVVLPAKIPNLLLNGTFGIAVGMATDIPPHNLLEITQALKHLIKNEDATTTDLLEYIKGPDFPGGGVIYDKKAIETAYSTGRGGVVMRGESEIVEEGKIPQIIITSLPYRANKARLIEKISDLVRNKKIEGVKDLRDESTDDIRIVLDLKQNAQPSRIQNMIYKHTQLEETYHFNMVGLLNGVPQTLTLHQLLLAFIDHRREIIKRATEFDLRKAKEREHIVEGLKKAIDHIDKIIALIKKSKEVIDARKQLMAKFKFTEIQANAILEMKLQKLSGLERKKVADELEKLKATIKELEGILKDKKKIDKEVVKGIEEVEKAYPEGRRTKVVAQGIGKMADEDLIPEKQNIVMISEGGYIKRTTHDEYKKQKRGGVGSKGAELKDEDFTTMSISVSSHDTLFFLTNKGKIYKLKSYELPEGKRTTKGKALVNYISIDSDERVTSIVPVSNEGEKTKYLFFVTKNGTIKKVSVDQFSNIRKNGIIAVSLEKGDQLVNTMFCSNNDSIIIITKNGKGIRFTSKEVRASGRSAKGVRGIKLGSDDAVIAACVVLEENKSNTKLLTLSSNGYGKQTKIDLFKIQKRGGSGVKAAEVTEKTGELVGAHIFVDTGEDSEVITMSKKGLMTRVGVGEIPVQSRQTQGVRVMKIKGGDILTSSTHM